MPCGAPCRKLYVPLSGRSAFAPSRLDGLSAMPSVAPYTSNHSNRHAFCRRRLRLLESLCTTAVPSNEAVQLSSENDTRRDGDRLFFHPYSCNTVLDGLRICRADSYLRVVAREIVAGHEGFSRGFRGILA